MNVKFQLGIYEQNSQSTKIRSHVKLGTEKFGTRRFGIENILVQILHGTKFFTPIYVILHGPKILMQCKISPKL